ncbi:hypothetical protein ABZ606_13995 [Streptomyces sp. NPDC012461]|uniref:hypothetical protein n=1 Tax=unclassified Streptomyces TaxID=2593676 RepID=UPI0033E3F641
MSEQQERGTESVREGRRQRGGGVAFAVGLVAGLAFFAFFPGLPHVIDWGAIVVSLAVGALARWAWRAWWGRGAREGDGRGGRPG